MKRFVKINENVFKLTDVKEADRQGGDEFDNQDANEFDRNIKDPSDQLRLAKEQLTNFISMLDTYKEQGVRILARDMIVMAKEILSGQRIKTY